MPSSSPSVLHVIVQQPLMPVHWTESVTAVATAVLALFAIASAFFAGRLWIETRKTRDIETALLMLDRCDNTELLFAETGLSLLVREGILKDLDTFNKWLATLSREIKLDVMRQHSLILSTYEHVGIVVRMYPGAAPILVDYLSLRAPQAFGALKLFIDHDRSRSLNPLVHCEFESLSQACEEFARRATDAKAKSNIGEAS